MTKKQSHTRLLAIWGVKLPGVFARVPDMRKEETVIIGDSLTSDMRGGKNFGLATIWYNPEHKENYTLDSENPVRPDHEIDALSKAAQVLRKL